MAERDILPSNSNRSKTELTDRGERQLPHVKTVARRSPEVKKEKISKKAAKLLLADNVDDIGEYFVRDLLVPGIKDAVINLMWALLWGDRRTGSAVRDNRKTAYNQVSSISRVGSNGNGSKLNTREREELSNTRRRDDILDNLLWDSKAKAEEVLHGLNEYLEDYDCVPVAILYELIGESPNGEFPTWDYGWTDLRRAQVSRAYNGWTLELPRPIRLKK